MIASALVTGNEATPQLAEQAVRQALAATGRDHANGILLFLTPEFARHAQPAVTAAARGGRCTQVAGGIVSGVFTEAGWALDRPAAAALVFADAFALGAVADPRRPQLSFAGGALPEAWLTDRPRCGGCFAGSFAGSSAHTDPAAWQNGRLAENGRCSLQVLGARTRFVVSRGLRLLAPAETIEGSNGYEIHALGGRTAQDSLSAAVPDGGERSPAGRLHQVVGVLLPADGDPARALEDGTGHPLAIIDANADGSLTLSERVVAGQRLAWAWRDPAAAEAELRRSVDEIATTDGRAPAAALMFSCIGRGAYFYGAADRDLDVVRNAFPGMPILGVYGTGQLAPILGRSPGLSTNAALQNAVVGAFLTGEA